MCDSASDVSKSVNVLVAIRWVALAWSKVQEETVRKCLYKAGVLNQDLTVVERSNDDPFADVDESCAAL